MRTSRVIFKRNSRTLFLKSCGFRLACSDLVLRLIRYRPFFKRVLTDTHSRTIHNLSERITRCVGGGHGCIRQFSACHTTWHPASHVHRQPAAVPVRAFLAGFGRSFQHEHHPLSAGRAAGRLARSRRRVSPGRCLRAPPGGWTGHWAAQTTSTGPE